MSLTKEMMLCVHEEIKLYNNEELLNYHSSYKYLNKMYPNSFYQYRIDKSFEEIVSRGIEEKVYGDAAQDW